MGGQQNSVRQIVHRGGQIGRKILLAPEERGHHVIWRQLGRRFRAKFWLAAKFASRAVSHQLHRRWHEDVRIAWYVRYPCFSLIFCIYRERPRLTWWGQCLLVGYCTWWWSTRSVITCEFFKCWSGTWNHRTPWWIILITHGTSQHRADHADHVDQRQPGVPCWSKSIY